MIFFIYNIRKTTSPGADRGVGSLQSIHTILVLTFNCHVFLNTVAFCNTYPNQPYTSHTLHAFSGSNGPYNSVLGIHFTTWVAPTMVRKGHNNRVSKFHIPCFYYYFPTILVTRTSSSLVTINLRCWDLVTIKLLNYFNLVTTTTTVSVLFYFQ